MKALVLIDYNQLEYLDFPRPEISEYEVLINVKACGICGSDVHGIDGSTGRRIPPIIMGHEASGIIVERGKKVVKWEVGDRVTFDSTIYPLNDWYTQNGQYNLSDNRMVIGVSPGEYRRHGAFAEYLAVPEHILYKLPENVSFEEAAMTEPVAVAAHALNISNFTAEKSALVVGAGMIGCFIIRLLKIAGATKIIATDISADKKDLALKYGADLFLDPTIDDLQEKILENTFQRGVDFSFDAAGTNSSVLSSITNTQKGGTITLVGNTSPLVEIPLQQIIAKQLSIFGSCAICGEYETVLDMIKTGMVDVRPMISKVAPLSEGPEWFRKLYQKEQGLNKVILLP